MAASCAWRRAGLLFAALALAACATPAPVPDKPAPPPEPAQVEAEVEQPEEPEAPAPKATGLRFEVEPAEAEIFIGEQSYGSALDAGGEPRAVSLPPGLYQVSIKRPGYATWRAEVSINEGFEVIRVSLVKR